MTLNDDHEKDQDIWSQPPSQANTKEVFSAFWGATYSLCHDDILFI